MDIRISGIAELRDLSARIRRTGSVGLGRQFGKALENVVEPIKTAITGEAGRSMPSGYGPTLARSMKHRRSMRATAREASLRLATYAEGKKERRDIPALNAGRLRHPVYGRTRKTRKGVQANPWVQQKVTAGFYDRGIESAADEAEKRLLPVVDDFTRRLMEG